MPTEDSYKIPPQSGALGALALRTVTVTIGGNPVDMEVLVIADPSAGDSVHILGISSIGSLTDSYSDGQVLPDQAGAAAVLTFTFTNSCDLIWVRSDGGIARADPFGGTPTASLGIQCDDGIPQPLTIRATVVKVFAPNGSTVKVWGYRYKY